MTALTQPATDQNRDNLAASMLIMLAMAGSALLVFAGIGVIWAEGRANRREAAFLDRDRPI